MTLTQITTPRGETIAGILELRPQIDLNREKPRLVLICHGSLGHKNYIYQKKLAEQLPFSSFRFDFRGNGDSSGESTYAGMQDDTEDVHVVAKHFEQLGYEIWATISHSRGSAACFKYATTCQKPLAHIVNVSGRYDMRHVSTVPEQPENKKQLEEQGFFYWSFKKRGKLLQHKIDRVEAARFANWDNTHVSRLPKSTSVLTCHGLADTLVPPMDAAHFANNIATHTLRLIPGADHNWTGKVDELVATILAYFDQHEHDAYLRARTMGQHAAVTIPRWIDVEGVKNFRDIGGWPVRDGSGYIRERIIFRCGHLADITPAGIATLKRLNVIAAFDFRSEPEVERQGVGPDIQGLTKHRSAIFSKSDYSPAALASRWKGYFEGEKGFAKVYAVILDKGKSIFRNIFLHLLANHSQQTTHSMIIHCTAGKDRTGVFIMLLMGLCGVDDEIIANEYAYSSRGYWEPEDELARKAEALGVSIDNVRMVMGAPYIGMKETIRHVNECYGSIQGYVQNECGLSDEQVQAIRDLMIVPIRFEERQLYRASL